MEELHKDIARVGEEIRRLSRELDLEADAREKEKNLKEMKAALFKDMFWFFVSAILAGITLAFAIVVFVKLIYQ